MRRGIVFMVLAAFLWVGMAPAEAQVKPRLVIKPQGQMVKPQGPRGPKAPRNTVKVKPPALIAQQVMAGNKGAKILGMKPNGNGGYVVTIKQQNTVRRIVVPGG